MAIGTGSWCDGDDFGFGSKQTIVRVRRPTLEEEASKFPFKYPLAEAAIKDAATCGSMREQQVLESLPPRLEFYSFPCHASVGNEAHCSLSRDYFLVGDYVRHGLQ
jgi:hypothetical protein